MSQLSSGDTSRSEEQCFFILLWSQEPWDLSSSPWKWGEESLTHLPLKQWIPASSQPRSRPTSRAGYPRMTVFICVGHCGGDSVSPTGDSECLGQIHPHGEMGPLLLCFKESAQNKIHGEKVQPPLWKFSVCRTVYLFILFSHQPISLLFLLGFKVYLVSGFCLYYAGAFSCERMCRKPNCTPY